jgi:phosphatidylglycerophosphatase A
VNRLILFIAEGFGTGRFPKAPGTAGTLVGLVWLAALLGTGSWAGFWLGALLGIGASVWLCGRAEKILGRHDPGSVVIDEIVALPLTYAGWLLARGADADASFPTVVEIFRWTNLGWLVAGFLLFRLFDIWKPWPIRQTQALPGGWGVTADDVVAGLVGGVCLALAALAV